MLVEEFLSRSTSRNSKKRKRKNTDKVLLLHLKKPKNKN